MILTRFSFLCGLVLLSLLQACGLTNTKKPAFEQARLAKVLEAQSEEHQARYRFRRPDQTMAFFGIAPGETVLEVLPGGGWYSRILAPYLGQEGKLIGVDYATGMFQHFPYADEAYMAKRAKRRTEWLQNVSDWGSAAEAYHFDTLPTALDAQVDTVLIIRGMHHLTRYDDKGGYLDSALQAAHRALKPGGKVGIVQHQAREDKSDAWATGAAGYIKKSTVIAAMNKKWFSPGQRR